MRAKSPRLHTLGSRKNNLAVSPALNQAGDLTNAQFPISNPHPKGLSDPKLTHFFRMNIENWELSIGQIFSILHSAKLFLREPFTPVVVPGPVSRDHANRKANCET